MERVHVEGLPVQGKGRKRSLESFPNAVSKTERIGYVDFNKRAAKIMLAGEDLSLYRAKAQLYDVVGHTDFNKIDWRSVEVRSLGFGLAEFSQFEKAVAQRKAIIMEQANIKAKQKRETKTVTEPEGGKATEGVPPSGGRGGALPAGGADRAPEGS